MVYLWGNYGIFLVYKLGYLQKFNVMEENQKLGDLDYLLFVSQ